MKLPLSLRLENPPAVFVGREAEQAKLAGLIQRGALTVVWGFSGMGKSALLAQVIGTRFTDARDRCVVVDVSGAEDGPVAAGLRALARVTGAELDAGVADPEAAAEALLELAEPEELWLVLENVASAQDEALLAAMEAVRRFAREMKLIVLSREDPRRPSLAAQTVEIGLMPDAELTAMLQHHRAELSSQEARDLVRAARGSPWRLLQLTVGEVVDDAGPERSLLQLAPTAQGLLRTLSLVPGAVRKELLGRAVRMPSSDAISTLARRGFLELSTAGLRLHDAARPFVESTLEGVEKGARTQKLLKALLEEDDDPSAVAALALALRAGETASALEVVDKHGEALLQGGYAPQLSRVFASVEVDPALYAAWCRFALEAGDEELAALPAPAPGAPVDARAAFVRVLLQRGDPAAAQAALDALDDDERAARPRLAARCALALGRHEEALAALAEEDEDDWEVLEMRARAALALGRPREAAAATEALGAQRASLPERALAAWASLLLQLGRPAEALEVAAPLAAARNARLHRAGRRAAVTHARALLALGRLDEAEAAASPGGAVGWTELRARLRVVDLEIGVLRGELDEVEVELDEIFARATAHGWREVQGAVDEVRRELRRLRAQGEPPVEPRLVEAGRALAGGDTEAALAAALRARVVAADAGDRVRELEAQRFTCAALAAAGDLAGLGRAAQRLGELAEETGAARYAVHARFFAAHAGGALDAGLLQELARARHRAPRVARLASAILGDEAALDDVDAILVEAVRGDAEAPGRVRSLDATGGADTEWVVDEARQAVLLPSGGQVDLARRKVLLDLLVTLCKAGGQATKEDLLVQVWGVKEYHPLNHDNRLKVAVRKLRRLLEEPLGDEPVEAADEGYRLRGRVRFVPAG